MSAITTIEVTVKTCRQKVLAKMICKDGTLTIDGTLNIAAEALAELATHSASLPIAPKSPAESEVSA